MLDKTLKNFYLWAIKYSLKIVLKWAFKDA